MHVHIWSVTCDNCQVYDANANNPDGYVIGQLYEIKKGTAGSAFFCLRQQNISHNVGDTMLVLDVGYDPNYPKMSWKNVVVLINDRTAAFKIWAFQDLISTQSIKLVK
mgnify:CR=1 FL=1